MLLLFGSPNAPSRTHLSNSATGVEDGMRDVIPSCIGRRSSTYYDGYPEATYTHRVRILPIRYMVHMHLLLMIFVRRFDLFFGNPFDPQVLSDDHSCFFSNGDRSVAGVCTDVGRHDAAI